MYQVMLTVEELQEFLKYKKEYKTHEMVLTKYKSFDNPTIVFKITFNPKTKDQLMYEYKKTVNIESIRQFGEYILRDIRCIVYDSVKHFEKEIDNKNNNNKFVKIHYAKIGEVYTVCKKDYVRNASCSLNLDLVTCQDCLNVFNSNKE